MYSRTDIFGTDVFGCHLDRMPHGGNTSTPSDASTPTAVTPVPRTATPSAATVAAPAATAASGLGFLGQVLAGLGIIAIRQNRGGIDPNQRMFADGSTRVNFGNVRVNALHGVPVRVPRNRYFVGPVHSLGNPVPVPGQRYFVGPVHDLGAVRFIKNATGSMPVRVPRQRFMGNVNIHQLGLGAGPDGLGNY